MALKCQKLAVKEMEYWTCGIYDSNLTDWTPIRICKVVCTAWQILKVAELMRQNKPSSIFLQGMDFTTDKLRSLVRKWQTLIEAYVDVKTTDGYVLRMFCIGFTRRRDQQIKRTCYAQSSQIRQIRRKMVELMTREAAACDLKELVGKFIPEVIGKLS